MYELSEVFDESTVAIYRALVDVALAVDLMACVCQSILITKVSVKTNPLFKWLGMVQVALQTIFVMLVFVWKPITLGELMVFYSVGIFSPLSAEGAMVILCTGLYVMYTSVDLFLGVYMMKHFKVTSILSNHPGKTRILKIALYTFLGATNALALVGTFVISFRYIEDPLMAQQKLRKEIGGVERLLLPQPTPLYLSDHNDMRTVTSVCGALYVSSRVALLSWVLLRDFIFVHSATTHWSKFTRQKFNMAIKSVLVQVCLLFVCGWSFGVWINLQRYFPHLIKDGKLFMAIALCGASFPTLNFLITLVVVDPYRRFLLKFIAKFSTPQRVAPWTGIVTVGEME